MKIKNDWKWAEPYNKNDWNSRDSATALSVVSAVTAAILVIFVSYVWIGLLACSLPLVFLRAAQNGNSSALLGSTYVIEAQRDYPYRNVGKLKDTHRSRLWKFYNSLHEDIRKDIGKLSIEDIKDLPEAEAQRMWQIFDNLETAYWENKRAIPKPVITSAIENATNATKIYKDMAKEYGPPVVESPRKYRS
jgi:hypothetical protein